MKRKPKDVTPALIRRAVKLKKEIADRRDKLRDLCDELSEITEGSDEVVDAIDQLERAVDRLSEQPMTIPRPQAEGCSGMKATIEVSDRKEADEIRRGLADPGVRAFVKIMGALLSLSSDRARRRVLGFVADKIAEERGDGE